MHLLITCSVKPILHRFQLSKKFISLKRLNGLNFTLAHNKKYSLAPRRVRSLQPTGCTTYQLSKVTWQSTFLTSTQTTGISSTTFSTSRYTKAHNLKSIQSWNSRHFLRHSPFWNHALGQCTNIGKWIIWKFDKVEKR